jgi:dTDP-4-dehydrorhamnose reductase
MGEKVAVLGASGLLGRHLIEELGSELVGAFDRKTCDVTILEQVLEASRHASLIINCAAFTNVDGAEHAEHEAYLVNALGADHVARAGLYHQAKVVHISTDFVFDGEKRTPYDEFDAPRPLSIYGRSKWAGEELFRRAAPRGFLVRVQGLYGRKGGNFASKLRDLILARRPLKLDHERRVQPSWARAIARQIVVLTRTDHFGVYHLSCKGATTWAGFARLLADRLGIEPNWEEVPAMALQNAAARPLNCCFSHRMLSLRNLDRLPTWEAALNDFLKEASS